MDLSTGRRVEKAVDNVQARLTEYASNLDYAALTPEAVHDTKVRIIDTLGALVAGFGDRPCQIARGIAARVPCPDGATVIGTAIRTTPDMAAFANTIASRCMEMNDTYHGPKSHGGHPSDVIMPVIAAAEHAQSSGEDLITGVVLAYEVYLRISDTLYPQTGYDCTMLGGLGAAVGAGKMLGLTAQQFAHCIAMAIVPNNPLNQGRSNHLSMWKAAAAGQAGRAGVFAALLARDGMEGPHLPFEGDNGWCRLVSKKKISIGAMGSRDTLFKIQETLIKKRACCATSVSSLLAAEKAAGLLNGRFADVKRVIVETYDFSRQICGIGEHQWNPDSRETADHSIPYGVAAALIDGTVTAASFDENHLWNPNLRKLMQKVEVVSNDEFTRDYQKHPVMHRSRVTVELSSGERLAGEVGADETDLSTPMSDRQIEDKFRGVAEAVFGARRVDALLDTLWNLEKVGNVAAIPAEFVMR